MLSIRELYERYQEYREKQEFELDRGTITEEDIMTWEEFEGTYIDQVVDEYMDEVILTQNK